MSVIWLSHTLLSNLASKFSTKTVHSLILLQNEEMRRTLGDKNPESGAVIQSLKQKILKLENQVRDKETAHV